jgi:hypothetical protein
MPRSGEVEMSEDRNPLYRKTGPYENGVVAAPFEKTLDMAEVERTTIVVSPETRELIKRAGIKGQTYDQILKETFNATKSERNFVGVPPEGTPSSGDGRIRGTPAYLPKHEIRHPGHPDDSGK